MTVINNVSEEMSSQAVETDRYKLTQVLRNMLSNALKFTPRGGRVTVEIRQEVHALALETASMRTCLVVDVTDTGVGISQVR